MYFVFLSQIRLNVSKKYFYVWSSFNNSSVIRQKGFTLLPYYRRITDDNELRLRKTIRRLFMPITGAPDIMKSYKITI